ncbi:MAG: MexH family multidrug efflux RND transporter periplasmic adaptor subunit [Alphaproteobacteria bacterium]|nr:MAG: MexH family multidrug efflux RND transporter periplasmic adaptor subunit [Alphaproteobacteria bacterium]
MSWWKQVALAAVVVVLAALAWLRLSPEAATRLGVPPAVVAVLGGSQRDPGNDGASRSVQGFNPADRHVLVVTAPVGSARINDRFSAIGDGEALRSVTVVPLSTGILTRINVAAGDRVKAGDVLAELDQEGEQIARDRAALALAMAAEKLDRYERLVSSRAASAVQLNEARNEHENARLALRDAELTLKRRALIAPIDGTIGLVPVDAGDYVTTQTEIATIDDRSGILVDFWVPERFAGGIRIGLPVEAVAIAIPGEVFSGVVAEIASRVDRASRTLQVRARLDNPDDTLRPGMSFKVTMRFSGDEFPAIHPLAVQWSSGGAFVWKEQAGRAVRTPVRIVQRNSDSVLVDGDLASGDALVIEGVQTLRDGVRLRIAGESEPAAPPPAGS